MPKREEINPDWPWSKKFPFNSGIKVGDTLYVEIEVTELKPTSDGKRGLVRTRNTIVNQRGEAVIEYAPLRMQKRRPAA